MAKDSLKNPAGGSPGSGAGGSKGTRLGNKK